MKHLKKFNESFTQTDIDEILDMFQEIADEYNLTNRSIGGLIYNQGYNTYIIETYPETIFIKIVTWISSPNPRYGMIIKDKLLKKLQDDIINFAKRLSNIGYNVLLGNERIDKVISEDIPVLQNSIYGSGYLNIWIHES